PPSVYSGNPPALRAIHKKCRIPTTPDAEWRDAQQPARAPLALCSLDAHVDQAAKCPDGTSSRTLGRTADRLGMETRCSLSTGPRQIGLEIPVAQSPA